MHQFTLNSTSSATYFFKVNCISSSYLFFCGKKFLNANAEFILKKKVLSCQAREHFVGRSFFLNDFPAVFWKTGFLLPHFRFTRYFASSLFFAFRSSFSFHIASSFSTFRVCIVGSGPSGFYSAKYILKQIPNAAIDMIEKLPAPFGLVRYGVAPDHPEIKVVTNHFDVIAQSPNFRFFGNVQLVDKNGKAEGVGGVLSLNELKNMYHAIVLAYGAAEDKKLHIEGENLVGVMSARQFVGWYNGHPNEVQYVCRVLDSMKNLQSGDAVIVGNGNVALDVARILRKPYEQLEGTDISVEAAEWLKQSKINKVFVVGRRGWGQCLFTNKELRGILEDDTILCVMHPEIYQKCLNEATSKEIEQSRIRKRQQKMMEKMANNWELQKSTNKKVVEFLFLFSPKKLVDDRNDGHFSSVILSPNKLEGEVFHQKAVPDNNLFQINLKANLFISSVGYLPILVDNLPQKNGMLIHEGGRIFSPEKTLKSSLPNGGIYVVGWLKRGANGLIASNIADAKETVQQLVDDYNKFFQSAQSYKTQPMDLENYLKQLHVPYVNFREWLKIKNEEIRRGKIKGKIAEKITDVQEMLQIAKMR